MQSRLRRMLVVAGLFVVAVPSIVHGQADAPRRMGLGVAISDANELLLTAGETVQGVGFFPVLLVPIDIGPRLRVEPAIGAYRYDTTDSSAYSGSTPTVQTRTFSLLHVGAGVFGRSTTERVMFYYGARVAYLRYTRSSALGTGGVNSSDTSPNRLGLLAAPTVGAEVFVADHFSFGAEARLKLIWWGYDTVQGIAPSQYSTSTTGNSISTSGAFVARFYFQ